MVKNRLHRILSRVADIKPGEEVTALLFFSFFFLITAPYTIIKSVRNASYLDTLKFERLPLAYLATALIMGLIVALHSKIQEKVPRQVLIKSSLAVFLLSGFVFWALMSRGWAWLSFAYWIWSNIFVIVLTTQFWIAVNDVFNPRQAKRLIGFFGSGGIFGGIVGGLLAGNLARTPLSGWLQIFGLAMLAGCVLVVDMIFRLHRPGAAAGGSVHSARPEKEPRRLGFQDSTKTVLGDPYLRLLGALVTVTLIVSTLIDFQFNGIVQEHVSGIESLTAFFGYFNAGMMAFAFFLQLLMTSSVIKRYGIQFSLLIYPVVLLLSSMGVAVLPVILMAVVIKGSDKGLSFSINQSVRELLYIPVSPVHKYKAKIFIDMFLNRFAKGIGAIILMLLLLFHQGIRTVSIVSAVCILIWVLLNLRVSREYTNKVKQKLDGHWERADKVVARTIDKEYLRSVFNILESRERSPILYAMHLFELMKQDKLTPEIQKLIGYSPEETTISSLGTFFETGESALVPEGEDQGAEETLDKEVREIMSLEVYQELMGRYAGSVLADGSESALIARMEIAKAIGMMDPNTPLVRTLESLLRDRSPEVCAFAMQSAAKLRRREHVSLIVENLKNPLVRDDALEALEKYGTKIVGMLSDYLLDGGEDLEVRRSMTDILARIGSQEAADFLLWALELDVGILKPELIDALDRIRSEKPEVEFQPEAVKRTLIINVERYARRYVQDSETPPSKKRKLPLPRPAADLEIDLSDIFKLLGLLYPYEEVSTAYRNIMAETADSTAYAIELLDNMLKKEFKEMIFPLVESLNPAEKAERIRRLLKTLSQRKHE